ncbi:MAG TPA: hypothetical protein DET40_02075 [Lentisphaeria bacterium]|nr:MAG: hypothetical protein A2X45_10185 [Lentisphaerae bacterium GWF2_50_93]HCE42320.1 hypothetical protein [Lentisphaeria bacterium]
MNKTVKKVSGKVKSGLTKEMRECNPFSFFDKLPSKQRMKALDSFVDSCMPEVEKIFDKHKILIPKRKKVK